MGNSLLIHKASNVDQLPKKPLRLHGSTWTTANGGVMDSTCTFTRSFTPFDLQATPCSNLIAYFHISLNNNGGLINNINTQSFIEVPYDGTIVWSYLTQYSANQGSNQFYAGLSASKTQATVHYKVHNTDPNYAKNEYLNFGQARFMLILMIF